MPKKYEIEVRGLLTADQYRGLDNLFRTKGKFKYNKGRVGVCYPDPDSGSLVEECKTDIRVRTTDGIPEIIIKQGEWGKSDESRRELSVTGERGKFDELVLMLAALGHKKGIVVVRSGNVYDYKDVEFSLVEVPNHSYYFEAEVMVSDESEKPKALKRINKICTELGLEILSQQEFFDYINKLNKEANEPFDFANYTEGDFKKRFGI